MHCEFPALTKGSQCKRCGYALKRDYAAAPIAQCIEKPAAVKEPGKLQQAWSYATAVAAWKVAGSPERSQEEINRLFTICKACPNYLVDDKRPRCKYCGCSCNEAPEGLNNKLAMATTSCPVGKW